MRALALLLVLAAAAAAEQSFVALGSTDAEAVADADAAGGRAATSSRPWQPIAAVPPPDAAEATVWVRHRGGPLCLKSVDADDHQRELGWIWARPARWSWTRVGRWPKAAFGAHALLIRGGDGEPPIVDRVVYGDEREPADLAPAEPIAVAIDAAHALGAAAAYGFGVNACRVGDPAAVGDPAYRAALAALAPRIVRAHHGGLLGDDQWVDVAARAWRAERVVASLRALATPRRELLVNIPSVPPWLDADGDGFPDAGRVDDYAAFCADLVRIANRDAGLAVRWWEPTNELDDRAWVAPAREGRPSRADELARVIVACARAMRAVDPTIRVGGPAAARPDQLAGLETFLRAALPDLDFVSWHAYASGDAADADAAIYDRAAGIGRNAQEIDALLARLAPDRRVPRLLDEVNVSWTWETRDVRMANHKGAVFDALVFAACAGSVDALVRWNDCDGIYGALDPSFRPRPAAVVLAAVNAHARGRIVATTSADPVRLVAFATLADGGERFALLINRANAPCRVALSGWSGERRGGLVDEDGVQPDAAFPDRELPLPRHAVLWLVGH